MTRVGPYSLHIAWHSWALGRSQFWNAVILHWGPFHFVRPVTEADWFA